MSTEQSVLAAIDLDSTTFDTGKFYDEIVRVCADEDICSPSILHDARNKYDASGQVFDLMSVLSDNGVGQEKLETLAGVLGSNKNGEDFLLPGANEFFETLDELGVPHLTLTWGAASLQLPKLRATDLDKRPYLITDDKKKGELIQRWKTPEGYRVVAAAGEILVARTGILIDDKAESFEGLPEDWAGFLVRRNAPRPSQMGAVPERVVTVPDLAAITAILTGNKVFEIKPLN